MPTPIEVPILAPMPSASPHRVVIAGGGVAALEALLVLRETAEERVDLDLLTPNAAFAYRQMEFASLFAGEHVQRFDLHRIAADQGATLVQDRLEGVWPDAKLAITQEGTKIPYDSLLIAIGARLRVGVPGAITVGAPGLRRELMLLIDDLEHGLARSVAFAAPGGVGWLLPLYELALMIATRLDEGSRDAKLFFVTPEEAPLEVFGAEASRHVEELLHDAGIELLTQRTPVNADANGLVMAPNDHGRLEVDRVVALPTMTGPSISGVPASLGGFLPVDAYGNVLGVDGIYAAGDGTSFPVKQGGLAAQQAAVAATSIAALAGAPVTPEPFRPVLRGLLLTGHEPAYIRTDLTRPGVPTETADRPLWWPPAKVAARTLAPYLAARPGLELRPTT
jgi:sulfide:quinone oxidoreductase